MFGMSFMKFAILDETSAVRSHKVVMLAQPSESTVSQLNTLEALQNHLQRLTPAQQQQVLDFVEFLAQKDPLPPPQKTIWEKIRERMAEVPDEEWELVPTDGSYQHDHYLYGTPKREL
jgi:hypothetical protein